MAGLDQVRTLVNRIPTEKDKARWEISGFSWLELDTAWTIANRFKLPRSGCLMTLFNADFRLWMGAVGEENNPNWPERLIEVGYAVTSRDCSLSFKPRVCIIHQGREIIEKPDMRIKVQKHEEENFGWSKFATYKKLREYAEDDVLVLQLEVEACQIGGLEEVTQVPSLASTVLDHGRMLSRDFGELLHKGIATDVEFCLKGAEPLRAHKLVLAARSPVFESMLLSSGMAESASNSKVELLDTELDVVHLFLQYMYTDKVPPETQQDNEMMCHLLALSHKYQVQSLVDVCADAIAAKLSDENACERLMMADLLGVARLKQLVLCFVTRSKEQFARVQSTEGYARMVQQRPHILADILSQSATVVTKKRPPEPEALPADLESLTLVNLKRLLSDRGLSTSGSKQALVNRLRSSPPSAAA
mmetsp:Transcript_52052/g.100615  ORF Transcript_52052/g.100615 Transcript_52052/m.100615 type:complete len:418 (-) Transcript_52052:196-1449(-)